MKRRGFASAIIWTVSLIAIFLASIIFLAGLYFILEDRGSEDSSITFDKGGGDLILQENFHTFLDKSVVFEGNVIKIIDLVESNEIENGDASDLFGIEGERYFEPIYPFPLDKWRAEHPWWVRGYNRDDVVRQGDRSIDTLFHAGAWRCVPFTKDSITLVQYTENKKIVFCVMKKYYGILEDERSDLSEVKNEL
jgi:hypothetical protein